jgi:hypothetical protein
VGGLLKKRARRGKACRLIHFSLQWDHVHLVVEAADRQALARGISGLLSGIARVANKAAQRRGQLFLDRYHERTLETPRQVRNGIRYVLFNGRHHAASPSALDPFSSGAWFTGWAEHGPLRTDASPVDQPATWLSAAGWRQHGLLRASETIARGDPLMVE